MIEGDSTVVDVRRCELDRAPVQKGLLSSDERDRAVRFRDGCDRFRYMAGRAWLRSVVAEYAHVSPAELKFEYGPMGKPSLAFPPVDLEFSLSHSGPFAILAITRHEPIGIDIERHPGRTLDPASAALVLSPTEQAFISSATDAQLAFLQCWTRKEAFAKVGGRGLDRDLARLSITGHDGQALEVNGYSFIDVSSPQVVGTIAAHSSQSVRWR